MEQQHEVGSRFTACEITGGEMNVNSLSWMVCGISLAAFYSVPASAQQVTPGASQDEDADEISTSDDVIVVTGQKRGSLLQDTPATITAIAGDELVDKGITNVSQLQTMVTGLRFATDTSMQQQIYIRGVGNNIQGLAANNSVAMYVDGVFVPNSVQALQGLSDVSRIEVLKGPQSTLYGRNATGGAIAIISKAPALSNSAELYGAVGNFERADTGFVLNRLISNGIAARVSFGYTGRQGYATNVDLGTHPGSEERLLGRAALLFDASDQLEILIRGDYSSFRGSDYNKNNNNYLSSTLTGNQYIDDPWKIRGDIEDSQRIKDGGLSATVRWTNSVGRLTSVTSLRKLDTGPYFIEFDNNNSYAVYNNGRSDFVRVSGRKGGTSESSQFYHESYLSTDESRPLSAVFGVFFFRERGNLDERTAKITGVPGNVVLSDAQYDRRLENDAAAGYVDGKFRVTEALTLSAGVRYSWEKKFYSQDPFNPQAGFLTIYAENSDHWTDVSPRAGFEFRPKDDLLVYAGVAKGFKSGGFNEADPRDSFEPEKIWAYNAGLKSRLLGERLTFNVEAFYYDYKDIQIQRLTPETITRVVDNAASAKLYGVEAEVIYRVSPSFRLSGNATVEHTELGKTLLCDSLAGPCLAGGLGAGFVNPEGNRLPNAPALSAVLSADYEIGAFRSGRFRLHGDVNYTSRVYVTPFQERTLSSIDPNWLLSAAATYERDAWSVTLFGQNLSNSLTVSNRLVTAAPLYVAGPLTGQPIGGAAATVSDRLGAPRTFGLRLGYKW